MDNAMLPIALGLQPTTPGHDARRRHTRTFTASHPHERRRRPRPPARPPRRPPAAEPPPPGGLRGPLPPPARAGGCACVLGVGYARVTTSVAGRPPPRPRCRSRRARSPAGPPKGREPGRSGSCQCRSRRASPEALRGRRGEGGVGARERESERARAGEERVAHRLVGASDAARQAGHADQRQVAS